MALPTYLPITTLLFLTTALLIKSRVKKAGPFHYAGKIIKYNSLIYSIFSFCLFLAILSSFKLPTSFKNANGRSFICSSPTSSPSEFDKTLGLIFHFSKLYEYIDVFNVLAAGGYVNAHFWFHHFTTPYLTYYRVLRYPTGWKIFGALNTFHHAIMYAYFSGGVSTFSGILPWTGYLQLFAGMVGEVVVVSDIKAGGKECGDERGLWASYFGLGIHVAYAVLFLGDVWNSGEKGKKD